MNGKGYVQISRGALDADIWEDPYNAALYFYCLLNASYNYYKGLEPGQFYSSVLSLSKKLGWCRNTVALHLNELVRMGLIEKNRFPYGMCFTVIGWSEICKGLLPMSVYLPADSPGMGVPEAGPAAHLVSSDAHLMGSDAQMVSSDAQMMSTGSPTSAQMVSSDAQMMSSDAQMMSTDAQNLSTKCSKFEPTQEYNTKNNNNSMNIPKEREREFEAWWRQYPRHEGRSEARKLWMELRRTWSARTLAAALERAKQSSGWLQNRQYIPSAARWLDGGWEDYLDPEDQGGASEWKEY